MSWREEYRVAVEEAGVRDRSGRVRWAVTGRDPVRMLEGLITASVPLPLSEGVGSPGDGASRSSGGGPVLSGRAAYAAVLTPKGRMLTDLRVLPRGAGGGDGLLLDLPAAAAEATGEHFRKFLPPRFASVADASGETGMLTVMGPAAAALVSREATGLRAEETQLAALAEDDLLWVRTGGEGTTWPDAGILIVRTGEVGVPAFDVLADRATVRALGERLRAAGAGSVGEEAWEALRIAAGRPAWGAELDERTLPPEAGLDRALDWTKGCYTGQEVMVRIRDRGHVNRHLRRLVLEQGPTPPRGTELFLEGTERAVGEVTSSTASPRGPGALALAYVRRQVEPPAAVRVGGQEGPEGRVDALDQGGDGG